MQSAFLTYCTLPYWNGVKLCPQFCVGIFLTWKLFFHLYKKCNFLLCALLWYTLFFQPFNTVFCTVVLLSARLSSLMYCCTLFCIAVLPLYCCSLFCTAVLSYVLLSFLCAAVLPLYCCSLFCTAVLSYVLLSFLCAAVLPLNCCSLFCTAVLSSVLLSSFVLSFPWTPVCPSWLSCPYGHTMPIKPILHYFSLPDKCLLSCPVWYHNPLFMSHLPLLWCPILAKTYISFDVSLPAVLSLLYRVSLWIFCYLFLVVSRLCLISFVCPFLLVWLSSEWTMLQNVEFHVMLAVTGILVTKIISYA